MTGTNNPLKIVPFNSNRPAQVLMYSRGHSNFKKWGNTKCVFLMLENSNAYFHVLGINGHGYWESDIIVTPNPLTAQ